MDKLIKEKGILSVPFCEYYGINYRIHPDHIKEFTYQWVYWYDGVKFVIGHYPSDKLQMVEVSTGATAVFHDNISGKVTVDKLIDRLKELLKQSGKTMPEVVSGYNMRNLDIELWKINSLII